MHKVFESKGKLSALTDFNGKRIETDRFTRNVFAQANYMIRPSPHEPLIIDVYGRDLVSGSGQWTERLTLENGVTLTGKLSGVGVEFGPGKAPKVRKLRMHDIQEDALDLDPSHATSRNDVEIDAAVFGVVSSSPLAQGACSQGWTRPGFPFSHSTSLPDANKNSRSSHALRLEHAGLEILFSGSSNYWRALVDQATLQHESIVGVRRMDRGVMPWEELGNIVYFLESFIGWINHCSAPVFHLKGYRRNRLVYRGYQLQAKATIQRDAFSWLPMFRSDEMSQGGDPYIDVQELFDLFVKRWKENERKRGIFHTALGLLSSNQKGSPNAAPPLGYLRDTFTACAILEGVLTGCANERDPKKHDQIAECLGQVGEEDRLPFLSDDDFEEIVRCHPRLWRSRAGKMLDDEKRKLSRPLANLRNWVTHLEDPKNAQDIFELPWNVQRYFLEVSIWLADLMALKAIGYRGEYQNRITGSVELVPWART